MQVCIIAACHVLDAGAYMKDNTVTFNYYVYIKIYCFVISTVTKDVLYYTLYIVL